MMLIDAHCHFFTKNILTQSLSKLESYMTSLEKLSKPASTIGPKELQKYRDQVFEFANHAIEKTPLEMYETMKEAYGQDFIAVPLMLDFSYTFIAPKDKVLDQKKSLLNSMKSMSEKQREKGLIEWMDDLAKSIEDKIDYYDRSVIGVDVFKNAYEEQIKDLTRLKKERPDRVYPFFSIDPRRNDEFDQGILGEIKKYIGRDKPFTGLKLYTSLGYSPTHPILYDDSSGESVYGYCEKHQIPITIHASLEGFSHMLDKSLVEGDIYYGPSGKAIPSHHAYKDGIVDYRNNFTSMSFSELTQERLLLLNHPNIWRKVLTKYPNLKLNMAHFGGIIQMCKFLKGNQTGFYAPEIIDLMKEFPNVYTDLSCLYNYEKKDLYMEEIYEKIYEPLPEHIKDRVMYGSDYYMLILFDTPLDNYIQGFRQAFGPEFKRISEENPKRFLFD
ncbi:hypothetical protein EZV73_12600 [Acidaminobacter sp. JC074]|uniref:amidohydrolase family protein n=1 Tax=Acidaminobacter sp. JC074 TaxID=2530199 RepID=UPI001F0F31D2|nr:amidohydrolase family protein [Acidaminobacter sp. JC074]MCH4888423.1 hypothetical protein [Acidaminobacter sp. JC074]